MVLIRALSIRLSVYFFLGIMLRDYDVLLLYSFHFRLSLSQSINQMCFNLLQIRVPLPLAPEVSSASIRSTDCI